MTKTITRKNNRLKGYDYSKAGIYFITICAKDHESIFGEIISQPVGDGLAPSRYKIKLTELGQIIDAQWNDISGQYNDVEIIEYVIMPNHIHGIIKIRATARVAPTGLGKIIGSFKSKCVNEYLQYIKNNEINVFADIWQKNYHDHVIRTSTSLKQVCKYIRTNLSTWSSDTENPKNKN
ncbi:MAG: hypothetical protein GY853_10460 [PVC group bacterium]|nr:hypothetical protein [PVC group bacterium]